MFELDSLSDYIKNVNNVARYKSIQAIEAMNDTRTKEQRWPLGTEINTPKGKYLYVRFMPSEKMPSHDEEEAL